MRLLGLLAAVIAGGVVAAVGVGTVLWNRATARAVGQLATHDARDRPPTVAAAPAASLPAAVQRYFAFALPPGQRPIRRARLVQRGQFLMKPGGTWRPFTAVEDFAVNPPGFVWDASIRMAPLLAVRVRDSHLRGQGGMHVRLLGVVPLVAQSGTPASAASTLQRYLAEAPWMPTALLPSSGVTWSAIDDSTARAMLTTDGVTAWVDFHFAPTGEILRTSTERYRDVDGAPVLTPWVGFFGDYERVGGMMIPRTGACEWVRPSGSLPYFRGRIMDADYEF